MKRMAWRFVVLMALVLGGCGGDDEGAGADAAVEADAAALADANESDAASAQRDAMAEGDASVYINTWSLDDESWTGDTLCVLADGEYTFIGYVGGTDFVELTFLGAPVPGTYGVEDLESPSSDAGVVVTTFAGTGSAPGEYRAQSGEVEVGLSDGKVTVTYADLPSAAGDEALTGLASGDLRCAW